MRDAAQFPINDPAWKTITKATRKLYQNGQYRRLPPVTP